MLIAIIIITIVLIAVLAALYAVYYKVFYSPHRSYREIDDAEVSDDQSIRDTIRCSAVALSQREYEAVTTRAYDGVTLSGRYLHHRDGAPLCICFHGYRGSAVRDFSMMGPFLYEEGYNVLLVDERAHGRSGGHTITYGVRERRDVLSWVGYASNRFGADMPIYLFGISMGAATVLMASGLKLPDNVRAIAADCPYSSPKDVILYVCGRIGLNPALCWPLIRASARLYGRFNVNAVTAEEAVKRTTKPILIIHGEDDTYVPAPMSEQVYRANPVMIERHTFPKAEHGLSYFFGTDRYQEIVRDFLRRHP